MNIAIILASGLSLRTKTKTPKQFLKINNKSIHEGCALSFRKARGISGVIIVVREEHLCKVKSIFRKYKCYNNLLYFCAGGSSRNASIKKALEFAKNNLTMKKDDIKNFY